VAITGGVGEDGREQSPSQRGSVRAGVRRYEVPKSRIGLSTRLGQCSGMTPEPGRESAMMFGGQRSLSG
jgi:hypothetical protein